LLSRLRDGLGDSLASLDEKDRRLAAVTTGSLDALKRYTLGLKAWNTGRYNDAVDLYREAVELDPDFASAYAALGAAYSSFIFRERELAAENFDAALARLDRVGRRELNFIRAQHAAFLGRVDEQVHYLELHLEEYPDDPSAHFNLGSSYRDRGQLERCVGEFEEVLRVAPRNAAAMINLATCLSGMGEDQKAIAAYREAFEIEPQWEVSTNINHEYGVTLTNARLYSEARELYEKRLASPDAGERGQAHRSLGHLELYRGQFESAVDDFRQAIGLHTAAKQPLSAARDLMFQAYAEIARGRTDAAIDALDQAAEIMPTDSGSIPFHVILGSAYLAAGDAASARRVSDRLNEWRKADGDQIGEDTLRQCRVLEARVRCAEGDPEHAIEALESEARLSTQPLPDLQTGLAEAYAAVGRWEDTDRALRRLIDLRWDSYEGLVPWITAHYRLGQVSERLDNPREAVAWYRRYLDLWGAADSDLEQIDLARDRLEALGG
jgi:tetratricopeptide (TPR) repeat protein